MGQRHWTSKSNFKGEVTYMTNSPRLSWLNNTKAKVEGITDMKNNEATIKIWARNAKGNRNRPAAAPMM